MNYVRFGPKTVESIKGFMSEAANWPASNKTRFSEDVLIKAGYVPHASDLFGVVWVKK